MIPEIQYCLDCSYELGEISSLDYHLFAYDPGHVDAAEAIIDSVNFEYGIRTVGKALNTYLIEHLYSKDISTIRDYILRVYETMENYINSIRSDAMTTLRLDLNFDDSEATSFNNENLTISLRKNLYVLDAIQRFDTECEDETITLDYDFNLIVNLVDTYARVGYTERDVNTVRYRLSRLRYQRQSVLKEDRKALKRSYLLAVRLGLQSFVKDFFNTGVVKIPSRTYDFVYVMTMAKFRDYTSPQSIRLALEDKSGEHMANLCVYFTGMPIIDALIGYYHYITQGLDDLIVKKANWFQVSEQGKQFQTQLKIGPDPFEHMRPIWAEETV